MTSDLEEIFSGITSGVQEEIDAATERLDNCMNNPQFIFFLFESLTEELFNNNQTIYTLAQIQIHNNLRTRWKSEFKEEEPIYWSPEIQENIAFTLLEASFSAPNQQRPHFIASVKFIIHHSFPFVCGVIERLIEIYSQNSTDVFCTNTYLQIAIAFSEDTANRLPSIGNELDDELLEEIERINSVILASVIQIIPNCIGLITQSEEACVIIYYSVKAIRYAILHVDEILSDQAFLQALQQIFEIILFNSSDEPILKIKIQIYKMIVYLNSTFLCSKMKIKTETRSEFAIFYRTDIVPSIIESTCQLLQMPMSYQLRKYVLNSFYQFIRFNAYGERIFTPEFLVSILLTNARLDDDDYNEAEINPYWFVQTQMEIELINDDYYTPRTFVAEIVGQAIEKFQIIDPLYEFFLTDSEDVFDYEAKMFLLYKFLKKLINLEKNSYKKKDKKKRSQVRPSIREEDFQGILQQLENPNPPFLTAALIRICSLVFKYFEPKQGLLVSQQIIMESESPIIAYYGSKMFNSCNNDNVDDDDKKSIFESIDVPSLIEKLIAVSSTFKDNVVPTMISSLCKINIEHLSSFGSELIKVLYELAYSYYTEGSSDDGYQACREIFTTINNIISEIEDDSSFLNQIMNETFEYTVRFLDEIDDDFNSYEEIFDVLALLNQKMSYTQQSQVEMLEYLLPYWEKIDKENYYSARQICLFIYPLITSGNNVFSDSPEAVQNITRFTEALCNVCSEMTSEDFTDKEGDRRESIGYSLFLASCIIQVFGIVNENVFLEYAISMLTPKRFGCIGKDCTLITIMGSIFVIASYLVVDPQTVQPVITEELVASFIKMAKKINKKDNEPEWITRYREMVVVLILLLNFARMGSEQAYHVAAMNIKYLLKFKEIEENGEGNDEEEEEEEEEAEENQENQEGEGVNVENGGDEEEEEEEDFDEISLLTASFHVPFDDFDIIQLFKEVSDQTGYFLSLPEELQKEVVDELNLN